MAAGSVAPAWPPGIALAFLEKNPDIAGAILRIFIRAVRTALCRTSPGAPSDAQLGALTFLHRFGSALNTHFHFHVVVLDGAFSHASCDEATSTRPPDSLPSTGTRLPQSV